MPKNMMDSGNNQGNQNYNTSNSNDQAFEQGVEKVDKGYEEVKGGAKKGVETAKRAETAPERWANKTGKIADKLEKIDDKTGRVADAISPENINDTIKNVKAKAVDKKDKAVDTLKNAPRKAIETGNKVKKFIKNPKNLKDTVFKGANQVKKKLEKGKKTLEKIRHNPKGAAKKLGNRTAKLAKTRGQNYLNRINPINRITHQINQLKRTYNNIRRAAKAAKHIINNVAKLIKNATQALAKIGTKVITFLVSNPVGWIIDIVLVVILLFILIFVSFKKASAEESSGIAVSGLIGDSTEAQVWWYLKDRGLSEYAIAGAMGNFLAETMGPGVDTSSLENMKLRTNLAEGGGDPYNTNNGYGIAQWTYERHQWLFDYASSKSEDLPSLQTQLEYFVAELAGGGVNVNNYEESAYSIANQGGAVVLPGGGYTISDWENATSATVASNAFEGIFERAGVERLELRAQYAEAYYKFLAGTERPASGSGSGSMSGEKGAGYIGKYTNGSYTYTLYYQNYLRATTGTDWGSGSRGLCYNTATAVLASALGSNETPLDIYHAGGSSSYIGSKEVFGSGTNWVIQKLNAGHAVVASLDSRDFYSSGTHAIVLLEYDANTGKVLVHNTYSSSDGTAWPENIGCDQASNGWVSLEHIDGQVGGWKWDYKSFE